MYQTQDTPAKAAQNPQSQNPSLQSLSRNIDRKEEHQRPAVNLSAPHQKRTFSDPWLLLLICKISCSNVREHCISFLWSNFERFAHLIGVPIEHHVKVFLFGKQDAVCLEVLVESFGIDFSLNVVSFSICLNSRISIASAAHARGNQNSFSKAEAETSGAVESTNA